jgi:hypothetical protein
LSALAQVSTVAQRLHKASTPFDPNGDSSPCRVCQENIQKMQRNKNRCKHFTQQALEKRNKTTSVAIIGILLGFGA